MTKKLEGMLDVELLKVVKVIASFRSRILPGLTLIKYCKRIGCVKSAGINRCQMAPSSGPPDMACLVKRYFFMAAHWFVSLLFSCI